MIDGRKRRRSIPKLALPMAKQVKVNSIKLDYATE
jgi:hypothetical protein